MPPYRFLPGMDNHPEKTGYLKDNKPKLDDFSAQAIATHPYFLYAIDLFNEKYFWEAHVYLEIFWNKCHRTGELADLLKGLIKVSAGFVKFQLKQYELGVEHLARAIELIAPYGGDVLEIAPLILAINYAIERQDFFEITID